MSSGGIRLGSPSFGMSPSSGLILHTVNVVPTPIMMQPGGGPGPGSSSMPALPSSAPSSAPTYSTSTAPSLPSLPVAPLGPVRESDMDAMESGMDTEHDGAAMLLSAANALPDFSLTDPDDDRDAGPALSHGASSSGPAPRKKRRTVGPKEQRDNSNKKARREQRLAYCVQFCLDRGWGYRKGVASDELQGYIQKSETMSLKRRLAQAKKQANNQIAPKDGRQLLGPVDETMVYNWIRVCNQIEMPVSDQMLRKAIIKTLEARFEAESKPEFSELKTITARQIRTIQAQTVTGRFIESFKSRHSDVLVGNDSLDKMQTRAKYAAAGGDTAPWIAPHATVPPPRADGSIAAAEAAAAAVVPPPAQGYGLSLTSPFPTDI